jgi:hypothetical protein
MKRLACVIPAVVLACTTVDDDLDDLPPPDDEEVDQTPTPPPEPDEDDGTGRLPAEAPWQPRPFGTSRFAVFYQLSGDVLDLYADPVTGLPAVADHGYVFTQSHASAFASRRTADRIHARRGDFYYAPAFDVWERDGWLTASDAQLRAWAHAFRDEALADHADLFTFNEAPSTTAASEEVRVRIAKLLRYLNEPDASGRRLRGVLYLTEKPSTASNWATPATAFWTAVDDTCDVVIVEHYHSQGYACTLTESQLSTHLFAMRRWLADSGNAAKRRIANQKYTVLHSSRIGPGGSGWAGADSTKTSLAAFQRALSKLTKVTRNTEGGHDRVAFGPITTQITQLGIHPRIALLLRHHYGRVAPAASETSCVAGAQVNCTCTAP